MAKQSTLARLEALEERLAQKEPVLFRIIRTRPDTGERYATTIKATAQYRGVSDMTIERSYGAARA